MDSIFAVNMTILLMQKKRNDIWPAITKPTLDFSIARRQLREQSVSQWIVSGQSASSQ